MVRGRRVLPHTKRRKRDRSAVLNSSITSQNHWTRGAVASTPLMDKKRKMIRLTMYFFNSLMSMFVYHHYIRL